MVIILYHERSMNWGHLLLQYLYLQSSKKFDFLFHQFANYNMSASSAFEVLGDTLDGFTTPIMSWCSLLLIFSFIGKI